MLLGLVVHCSLRKLRNKLEISHGSKIWKAGALTRFLGPWINYSSFPRNWKLSKSQGTINHRSDYWTLWTLWTLWTCGPVDSVDLWTCGPCGSVESMDLWTCGLCGPVDLWTLWTCGLWGPVNLWTHVDLWTCGLCGLCGPEDLCTWGNGLTHGLNYCLVSYFVWFIAFWNYFFNFSIWK